MARATQRTRAARESSDDAPAELAPMPRSASRRMDIELLRVLAVLAVMIFHFAPPGIQLVPQGYEGVDIFFTISGFVITAQMLRTRDRGEFTYASFLARRIRRLLPSAVLVIVVTLAVVIPFANPAFASDAAKSGAASLLYVANFFFAHQAVDYFGADGNESPFIHFWSLGVEEQFYVFWPIVFILIAVAVRRRVDRFMPVLIGVTAVFGVVSVIGASIAVSDNFAYAFFMPWWRAHQLMLGALVAVWLHVRKPDGEGLSQGSRTAVEVLRIACFVLLVVVCLQGRWSIDSPGWHGLIVSIPVAVILGTAWATRGDLLGRAGALKPLAWIAAASYVLYLWHWPVWVAIRDSANADTNGYVMIVGALLASFVLAALTHRFVEVPIHMGRRVRGFPSLAVVGVGVAGCVVLALGAGALGAVAANNTPAWTNALKPQLQDLEGNQPYAFRSGCFVAGGIKNFTPCVTGAEGASKSVMLMGDSHAAQWSSALGSAAASSNHKLITATKAQCTMIEVPRNPQYQGGNEECDAWRKQAYALVAKTKPDVLVLASDTPWDIPKSVASTDAEREAVVRSSAEKSFATLLQSAKRIVVLGDTPKLPAEPRICLSGAKSAEDCAFPSQHEEVKRQAFLRAVSGIDGVTVVDTYPEVCPGATCQIVTPDSTVKFFDSTHISELYSDQLTPWVTNWLDDALAQR